MNNTWNLNNENVVYTIVAEGPQKQLPENIARALYNV